MSRALTKIVERVSANKPQRKPLSVPDVEEGPTANRILQLKKLHVTDVVGKGTSQ